MSRLFEDEFKQNKKNENEKFQVEEKKIESQILEKPSIEKKRIKKIIGGKRDIIVMEKKVKNSQNKEKDELKSPINKTKTLIDLCNIEDSDEEAQEKFDIFEDLKLKKIKSCEAKDSLQLIKEIIKNTKLLRDKLKGKIEAETSVKNFQTKEGKCRRILEEFYELKTKEQLKYFPKIDVKMMKDVEEVWDNPKSDYVVVEHQHILEQMTVKNLSLLKDENWLNDEVINGYIRLVNKYLKDRKIDYYVANTFFYTNIMVSRGVDIKRVDRLLKRKKISKESLKKIFIPINNNNSHWSFIEISFINKTITYFDSMMKGEIPNLELFKKLANLMKNEEEEVEYKARLDDSFPIQMNGFDCGVFVLKGIDYLSRFGKIVFDQKDVPYLRYLICYELLIGKFLPYDKRTPEKKNRFMEHTKSRYVSAIEFITPSYVSRTNFQSDYKSRNSISDNEGDYLKDQKIQEIKDEFIKEYDKKEFRKNIIEEGSFDLDLKGLSNKLYQKNIKKYFEILKLAIETKQKFGNFTKENCDKNLAIQGWYGTQHVLKSISGDLDDERSFIKIKTNYEQHNSDILDLKKRELQNDILIIKDRIREIIESKKTLESQRSKVVEESIKTFSLRQNIASILKTTREDQQVRFEKNMNVYNIREEFLRSVSKENKKKLSILAYHRMKLQSLEDYNFTLNEMKKRFDREYQVYFEKIEELDHNVNIGDTISYLYRQIIKKRRSGIFSQTSIKKLSKSKEGKSKSNDNKLKSLKKIPTSEEDISVSIADGHIVLIKPVEDSHKKRNLSKGSGKIRETSLEHKYENFQGEDQKDYLTPHFNKKTKKENSNTSKSSGSDSYQDIRSMKSFEMIQTYRKSKIRRISTQVEFLDQKNKDVISEIIHHFAKLRYIEGHLILKSNEMLEKVKKLYFINNLLIVEMQDKDFDKFKKRSKGFETL